MRRDDTIHFCPPPRVIIGEGSRKQLPALLHELGYRNGLLVTDTFFSEQTPWVSEYLEAAAELGIQTVVNDEGIPDPTTTLCDEVTEHVLEQNAGKPLDHVIALGGGSNIDLAKALCLTLRHKRPIKEFIGDEHDKSDCLPLIALPTTAGTGSEATPGTILVDPDNATKVAVMHNQLRPVVALIDPEFTYTCPPKVTAEAGLDALTHAVESYLTLDSKDFERGGAVDPGYSGRSSLTVRFAHETVRLCAGYLQRAYHSGSDEEARSGMAYASHYAALSYGSAGLNAIHGIAYAVAGLTGKSHGATNAVVMPYVLDALVPHRTTEMAELARLFGINESNEFKAAKQLPDLNRKLVEELGIAGNFVAFGIAPEQKSTLLRDALEVTRLAKALPVPDVESAYERIIDNGFNNVLDHEAEQVMVS